MYHPNPEAANHESLQLTVYRVTSTQIKTSTSTPDSQTRQPRPHDRSQWPSLDRRQKAWHFDDNRHGNAASTGMRGGTGCRDWTDRSRPMALLVRWWVADAEHLRGALPAKAPWAFHICPNQRLGEAKSWRPWRCHEPSAHAGVLPNLSIGRGGVVLAGFLAAPASRCRHHAAQRRRMTGLRRGLEGGRDAGGWEVGRLLNQQTNGRAHGTVRTGRAQLLRTKDPAGIGGHHWSPRRTTGPGSEEGHE